MNTGELYTHKKWDQLLSDLNDEAEKLYFEKFNIKKRFDLITVRRIEEIDEDETNYSFTVAFNNFYDIVSDAGRNFINGINGSFNSINEYTYMLRRIHTLKDVNFTVRMYIAIMRSAFREFFASK